MQALIYQASLYGLTLPVHGSGLAPGKPVELARDPDYIVAAFVQLPSCLPFGLGKQRRRHLGYLEPDVAEWIAPALERQVALRVRIVEIEPAHARTDGLDQVLVSVWGAPETFFPSEVMQLANLRAQST